MRCHRNKDFILVRASRRITTLRPVFLDYLRADYNGGCTEIRVAPSTENIDLGLPAVWSQKARWLELGVGFWIELSGFNSFSLPQGSSDLYIAVQGLRVPVGLVSE